MSNVAGAANAPMHGHNSIQVRAQMTTLDVKFGNAADAANFNKEMNKAAADALKLFTTNHSSSQPAGSPGAFGNMPGLDMGAWQAKFNEAGEIGATLDKMESEAMRLLKSPKKEDQIKGQQMMQAMTAIMEAVMKAISAKGEAMKSAIQNSAPR